MRVDGQEVHSETDEARAGSTPHIVRWVLGISLVAAIVLLSIVWMTGAVMQRDVEDEANVSNMQSEIEEDAAPQSTDIDGIVIEEADEIETGTAGDASRIPNETDGATPQEGRQ